MSPAVTKVPTTPRTRIGQAERRKRVDADVQAAVEEDDDERDDANALDGLDGQGISQRLHGCAEDTRDDEEERCVRQRKPVRYSHSQDREEDASRDDEDDEAEVGDLGHERSLGIYGARTNGSGSYSLLTRF